MLYLLNILLIVLLFNLFFIRNTIYLIFKMLLIFIFIGIYISIFSNFIALLILLVYSGGIAILFLFSAFTLDIQKVYTQNNNSFLINTYIIICFYKVMLFFKDGRLDYFILNDKLNITLFSNSIYDFSSYLFVDTPFLIVFIALILLVAMLGAISCFNKKK